MSYVTPCALEVLLHYYCTAVRHRNFTAPAIQQAIIRFMQEGMLKFDEDGLTIRTTEKANFWLEHIRSIPFPVKQYRIPADSEPDEGILHED